MKIKCAIALLISAISFANASGNGKLRASMYAVPVDASTQMGTVKIMWGTAGTAFAQVWVSEGGNPEILFSGNLSDTTTVNWVGNGNTYHFVLYEASGPNAGDRINILDEIYVRGLPPIQPMIGANQFGLCMAYTASTAYGCGNGLDVITGCAGPNQTGYKQILREMARKSINDALPVGMGFFRFPVLGYYTQEIEMLQNNPADYWTALDDLFADLQAAGIKAIPAFFWNTMQLPEYTQTMLSEFVNNPNSTSYQLGMKFVSDFINRYKNNPAIYCYELTNEMNLLVDINFSNYSSSPYASDISTNELVAFAERTADSIRKLDPTRMISSGYGSPRSSAWHLYQSGGTNWTVDSYHEFEMMIELLHQGIDIISTHPYSAGDQERFGITGQFNAAFIDSLKKASDYAYKLLFLGEFGDSDPLSIDDPECQFAQNVMDRVVANNIPFAAVWTFETYQFNTFTDQGFNIDPPYNLSFMKKWRSSNAALGNPITPYQLNDNTPPNTLITFPISGTAIDQLQAWADQMAVQVKASDNNDTIAHVEFYIDGLFASKDSIWPYRHELDSANLAQCDHQIVAIAYDAAGNFSSDTITLLKATGANCTTGIKALNNLKIDMFPNPASQIVYLKVNEVTERNETLTYTITDIAGQIVVQNNISATDSAKLYAIDVSGLKNGCYLLHTSLNQQIARKTLIINN